MVVEKSLLNSGRDSFSNSNVVNLKAALQPEVVKSSGPVADKHTLIEMPFIDMSPVEVADDSFEAITRENESLLQLESEVCSYGDTVHYAKNPKIFANCSGSYLYDTYDTPYLDLQMWYSAVNLGYANERINNALKKQIDTLPQLACQYLHKEKIELSAKIVDSAKRAFGEKGRVHFNVGGSQAVEDALKLVRKTTGKSRQFAFEGGYHGRTLAVSSITSSYRYRENYGEFGDRAEFVPFPYCFRCPYGKQVESCELYCVQQIERKFEHEYTGAWNPKTKKSEFGAFVVETVQATGGYIIPPKGYFERLAKICKDHGILLIDDEVQMGLFRTGKLWAAENFNFTPDIMVFAKALTNGMNPLSTSVNEKGAYFLARLKDLQTSHPEIGHVDGLGLALRAELCHADGFTPSRELADRMFQRGLDGNLRVNGRTMGLVLDIGGYYKNAITLAPSLNITYEEIDLACDALDVLISDCKRH